MTFNMMPTKFLSSERFVISYWDILIIYLLILTIDWIQFEFLVSLSKGCSKVNIENVIRNYIKDICQRICSS